MAAYWLHLLLQRRPHQMVGPTHAPYLMRWFVLPHNRFVNVYVHKFPASDDPEVAHDHPWWFASLVISGSYKWAELHWMQHCDDAKNDFSRWLACVRWVRIATGGPS